MDAFSGIFVREHACGTNSVKATYKVEVPRLIDNGRRTAQIPTAIRFNDPIDISLTATAEAKYPTGTLSLYAYVPYKDSIDNKEVNGGGTCPSYKPGTVQVQGSATLEVAIPKCQLSPYQYDQTSGDVSQLRVTFEFHGPLIYYTAGPNAASPELHLKVTAVYFVEESCTADSANASSDRAAVGSGPREACTTTDDLAIDHVQVIQTVQDRNQTAKLVTGRDAIVRVFLKSIGSKPVDNADAEVTLDGEPLKCTVHCQVISAGPSGGFRADDSSEIDFWLPKELVRAGPMTLKSTAVIRDAARKDVNLTNNTLIGVGKFGAAQTLVFQALSWPETLRVAYAPVCFGLGSLRSCPPPGIRRSQVGLETLLPSPKAQIVRLPMPRLAIDRQDLATPAGTAATMLALMQEYSLTLETLDAFALVSPDPPHVIGFVLPGLDQFYKMDEILAADPLPPFWLFGFEGENRYQPVYEAAHATAHIAGLRENTSGTTSPYDPGLDEFTALAFGIWGQRLFYRVEIPDSRDLVARTLMTAKRLGVTTPGEWNELVRLGFSATKPKPASDVRTAVQTEKLVISGSIATDGSTGVLNTGIRLESSRGVPESDPSGDACLRFFANTNTDFCFKTSAVSGSNNRIFAITTPFPPGTQRVALMRGGREVTSIRSGTPPQVNLISPTGGESWSGVRTIRWTSTGTGVTFHVQYSPDGGTSWIPLSGSITDTQLDVDTNELLGGTNTRIRVMASAGIDTASATSGVLSIPQNPQLALSTTSLQFRSLKVGESESQVVRVSNTGSGQLLVRPTAPSNPSFELESLNAFILGPGEWEEIIVTFRPSAVGSQQGTVSVGGQNIAVQGAAFAGVVPSIVVTPVDLGHVQTGTTKNGKATIENRGGSSLILSSVALSGGGLSVPAFSPLTILPGLSADVGLRITNAGSGAIAGTLTINSNDPARGQVQVSVSARGVSGPVPVATAAGVLNAASFKGGSVSPGEVVTIFGSNVGPPTVALLALTQEGKVSTDVGQTRVFFDDVPAPIIYAFADQTSVVVPYHAEEQPFTSMVVEYQGRRSDSVLLPVAPTAPGLFSANSSGAGAGAILNQNGTLNTSANPAAKGSIVVLFGTGEGSTNPPVLTGSVTPGIVLPSATVTATIGGVAQKIIYAGEAPSLISGVLQVNLEIAAGTPSGIQPVVVRAGGQNSQPGLTIAVAGPAQQPAISVIPNSLDFGSVAAGQTRDLLVAVRNNGTAALTISSISSSNARYTVTAPAIPFNVAAGTTQNVTVRFSPTAAGVQSGTLTINSNDPATPTPTVNVTGTGATAAAPAIVIEPTSLDFANVTTGQTRDLTFSVRNTGTTNLTVSSISSSNARFTVTSPATPFNVAAGGSQTVTVRFSPTSAGAQAGTITVNGNDPANPAKTLSVSGTGTAAAAPTIAVSPASLAFGTVLIATAGNLQLTISNTGSAALNVTSMASSNALFTVTPAPPLSIAAGSSTPITVRFSPTAAGAQSGNLTIASNDPVQPNVQVALSGTGSVPAATNEAYWKFDEGSGTQANDSSGNNNRGTLLNGAGWTTGVRGTALSLDGVDDYVTAGTTLSIGSTFTVEAWFKGDPSMEAWGRIVDSGYVSGFALGRYGAEQQVAFEFRGSPYLVTTASLMDNSWHHVVVVKAGSTATIYADGTSQRSVAVNAGGSISTLPLFIGYNPGEGVRGHWKGQLDEIHIYPRALTASEIQANFTALRPSGGGQTPTISLDQTTLAFGNVTVAQTKDLTITVRNTGTASLSVNSIASSNARFTIMTATSFALAAGASQVVTVRFSPNAAGDQTGIITFNSNDPTNPARTVSVSGSGVAAASGTIAVGQTVNGTLTAASGRSVGCPNCYADVYRLTVASTQTIDIRMNSAAFDAYLQVRDLNGNLLAENDDSGGTTNARIIRVFQPGTYLIEASTAFELATGAYSLSLTAVP